MKSRKYKVLFADDEYWTREKIRRIIDWEKYSLEFLEPAADGEEVLKRIGEEKPDILISDINMPYLNGVELLKKIKEVQPQLLTFVISGYDDFDYVKESFMSGAINYLMKPVNKIDLVNALSKALEILADRQEKQESEKKQKLDLLRASSFIQDREYSQLLDTRVTSRNMNMVRTTHMQFAGACLILIKIHDLGELMQLYGYDINLLSFSVKKRLQEICGKEVVIFNHVYRSNEFLIILQKENALVQYLGLKIINDLAIATKSPITVVESEHNYSTENIGEAYIQDISCMMLRSFGKKSVVIKTGKEPAKEDAQIKSRISETHIREIHNCMKNNDQQGMKRLIFQEIGLGRAEENRWTYLEVRQTVMRFINIIQEEYLRKQRKKQIQDMQELREMADGAIGTMNTEKVCEVMTEIIEDCMNEKSLETNDSIRNCIQEAAEYVEEHFQDNITLTSLSGMFHVESSYFSRMFRKETGKNLMVYLCEKRMNKAIEYMKKSDRNLTEIAFMVGYDDYTYFNKVFKKVKGMSPREYRNSLNESEILK